MEQVQVVYIYLDNASQHKKKMQQCVEHLIKEYQLEGLIEIQYCYIPPYSPNMNLAEYEIQLIRKNYLKHLPVEWSIQQRVDHIYKMVDNKIVMTKEGIKNTLNRIKQVPFL